MAGTADTIFKGLSAHADAHEGTTHSICAPGLGESLACDVVPSRAMETPDRPAKDIYERKATSQSRGRTIQRIMDRQHAVGMIPGTEQVLAERPEGSIAEAVLAFHAEWVEPKQVTTRRAYERSLAFFARDLAEQGPTPSEPLATLSRDRLVAHLDWRLARGLTDPGELQRAALHLTRLCEWIGEHRGVDLDADRAWMRAQAAARIAAAPPAFHVATSADELRDTSADATVLGAD